MVGALSPAVGATLARSIPTLAAGRSETALFINATVGASRVAVRQQQLHSAFCVQCVPAVRPRHRR
eukprot:446089-Lingulodinium_polyedra.AAC.1